MSWLRDAAFALIGGSIGAGMVWWGRVQVASDKEPVAAARLRDREDSPESAGETSRRSPAMPQVQHVVVRVPASCEDPDGGGGGAENPAWPSDVPEEFRPDEIVASMDAAAAEYGVHVPYSVDCSAFPCMVILTEPLSAEDNAAVMAWANGLHNPGGVPNADMAMYGDKDHTVFFIYPDGVRDDPVFNARIRERANEILRGPDG